MRAPRVALAAALLGALLAAGASAQNRPSFTGVGDLAGGTFDSVAEAVSDDGAVVVGGSESAAGPQAFRWTAAGGIVGLGDLPGGIFESYANGVSANGSVIVGTGVNGADESRAFRWTSGGGLVQLNGFLCLGCPSHAFGNGVSANGLVAVGSGAQQIFIEGVSVDAARWTGGGTSISNMGHLSGGGDASEASAASSTGSLIVGSSDSSSGIRAFRWTSGGGMVALPDVPGAQVNAGAMDVSDDGSVIVGFANTSSSGTFQREAVRWVGPGYSSALLLGGLPGAPSPGSRALGVSADGSRIVGSANDTGNDDTAFLWDATNGMRELLPVLEQEYGLDLSGWRLVEARGISAVNAAGEFWIVGQGEDPAGNPQGWVALLSPTACNNGVDDDLDGHADFPADPQCTKKGDRSETPDCGDGLDNDGDGQIDLADGGCTAAADLTELPDCGDGIDNDGDLAPDLADAGCRNASSPLENPACQNGLDDDGDGKTDFPADSECVAADDRSELYDCADGIDNDGDGAIDHPSDPDCVGTLDPAEDRQCDDRIDNDANGFVDHPLDYPACQSAADGNERPPCGDGADNDGDAAVDFPADTGCLSASFGSEAPVTLALGDLLVLDRRSDRLFRLSLPGGAQTAISTGAQLGEPQGVALRGNGAIVVSDPAGLVEIGPHVGTQRRFSGPLQSSLSLQHVFDAAGDAVVLEQGRLTTVPFRYGHGEIGTPVTLLQLPVPGSLSVFQGDALAREASGSLLAGGFGLLGDGLYRIGASGTPVTKLTPGFTGDIWNDLAVEASGTILAAGTRFGVGPGVFRVNQTTGAVTALSTTSWTSPSAVAVGSGGRVFASDAGTCTPTSCTGSKVVELDPTTGAQLSVATGGSITGETDLAVVTVLPPCANGLDDDGDGKIDYPADPECEARHDPSEAPDCANGIDDDGDGLIDEAADPGCFDATSFSQEDPACDDGLDNDDDGGIDWDGGPQGGAPDSLCNEPYRTAEINVGCGVGAELALLLPLLAVWRRSRRHRSASSAAHAPSTAAAREGSGTEIELK
jgi:probable HAF family extracellular repeat protein